MPTPLTEKSNRFWQDKKSLLNLVIIFFLTLLFFQFRYGLKILDPAEMTWMMKYDWAQHYLGWYFFRNEPWTFPLGEINNLFYPIGTNIGFTDGIPLITIPLKLLSPILPEQFNFFGWWLFSIHILVAYFSIKFFNQIGVRGIPQLLGVILITFSPVLIYRAMHVALATHWVIIANFWVYFLNPKETSVRKILSYQLILLIIAGLINPYFALINGGFLFILSLKLWLKDKEINGIKVSAYVVGSVVVLAISWIITGFFKVSNASHLGVTNAYGVFSWNMSSLINPFTYDRFYDFYSNNLSHYLPAKQLMGIDQYESFSYLGLGLLILSAVAILLCLLHPGVRARIIDLAKRKEIIFLFVLTLLITIFAISNVVTFNDKHLFTYPVPDFLKLFTDIFRASARYIWLGYYLWIFFLVYVLSKALKKDIYIIPALLLICVIQFSDIRQMIWNKKLPYGPYKTILNEPAWYNLIASTDKVFVLPPLQSNYLTHDDWRYFGFISAKLRKPVSVGHIARIDFEASDRFARQVLNQIASRTLDSTGIYVTFPHSYPQFLSNYYSNKVDVVLLDGYLVVCPINNKYKNLRQVLTEIKKTTNQDFIKSHFIKSNARAFADSVRKNNPNLKSNIYDVTDCDSSFVVRGWAFANEGKSGDTDSVEVLLSNGTGKTWSFGGQRFGTKDVADHFHNEKLSQSGFASVMNTSQFPNGVYQLGLKITSVEDGRQVIQTTDLNKSIRIDNGVNAIELTQQQKQIDGIKSDINPVQQMGDIIELEGWAFAPGVKINDLYLSISNESSRFTYKATRLPRPDVASFFSDSLLVNSGFMVKFYQTNLPAGHYNLDYIFYDPTGKTYLTSSSGKTLPINLKEAATTENEELIDPTLSFPKPLAAKEPTQPTENIKSFVDKISEHKYFYGIEGWAFLEANKSQGQNISIILKSSSETLQFSCKRYFRQDVNDAFKISNADSAGFKVGVRKEHLHKGKYEIFVVIEKEGSLYSTLMTDTIEFE